MIQSKHFTVDELQEDSVHMQTILVDENVVGNVLIFEAKGDIDIMYAIDNSFWGKGITSIAVKLFLEIDDTRPIYGRVAFDNLGYQKV